jgi:hypothetical protein
MPSDATEQALITNQLLAQLFAGTGNHFFQVIDNFSGYQNNYPFKKNLKNLSFQKNAYF